MPPKTILVTGSNGQLGSELQDLAPLHPEYGFVFLTRAELPLHESETIAKTVARYRPFALINCAAYTAVDKAESEREAAFQINAAAVGALAAACAEAGARFLHISTDYVFDGSADRPRREEDAVNPVNVYGESKLAGEREAMAANPQSVVLRTSWVYSYHGKNFVKTMMRLMAEKENISVVADQWGSPTYAKDLAEAALRIVGADAWQPGLYHFSNGGVITWFDFAKEINRLIGSACRVNPTTTAQFPTPARRPLYSAMDKGKINERYGIAIRPWQESLQACVQRLTADA